MNEIKPKNMRENKIKQDANQQIKNDKKLSAGIFAPPILMFFMYVVYKVFAGFFGSDFGWFLGLCVYWMLCGLIFSACAIGMQKIKQVSRPQRFKKQMIVFIMFPVVMAFIFSYISGIEYEKITVWGIICLVITAFGNGIFEEILWRGVYMELYPDNFFLRIVYPTFWYAVFHFASGSVSSNSNALALVIGSAFFGIYLALLAKKTNTIWWSIVCHVLGAFVMIA